MTDNCWLYAGYKNRKGYGETSLWIDGKTRGYSVHRMMYEAVVGEIPAGLQLDHLCHVTSCINPEHLEPVTPAENRKRSWQTYTLQDKCLRGHRFTPENTYYYPNRGNRRDCRACRWVRVKEKIYV